MMRGFKSVLRIGDDSPSSTHVALSSSVTSPTGVCLIDRKQFSFDHRTSFETAHPPSYFRRGSTESKIPRVVNASRSSAVSTNVTDTNDQPKLRRYKSNLQKNSDFKYYRRTSSHEAQEPPVVLRTSRFGFRTRQKDKVPRSEIFERCVFVPDATHFKPSRKSCPTPRQYRNLTSQTMGGSSSNPPPITVPRGGRQAQERISATNPLLIRQRPSASAQSLLQGCSQVRPGKRAQRGQEATRFESMSFVVNILACKLKIVNNRNWKSISKKDIIKW